MEASAMMARLKDLFEGPAGLEPWTPPEVPAALHGLLPWRAFDETSELYFNASSVGFSIEIPPFAGIDAETLGALSGTLADAAPERCVVQVVHWASPRFGAALDAWGAPRRAAGAVQAAMRERRGRLFSHAGWRPLHAGGPPFTLSDYRVFLCAALSGPPGPAPETALSGFRRALEGTLASAGASARRLAPDDLLSLAAELTAPDMTESRDSGLGRPRRRWSPRDPLHLQCAAPGRALTVAPTGLVFHDPDGTDVAVRVLTASAFPEVWPGWRGNALIGDFHREFLQPGCPVLTCLTVVTGDEAAVDRAVFKAARATQQAGTGIARYLPGLPEKARDWQFVTERLKDGERLVRACYTAAVYAPLDAIDEAEQAVRAIYHGQGWRMAAERYVQLPSWLAGLPMVPAGGLADDLERMGRMRTLLTSAAVNLAPVHGEWRGQGFAAGNGSPDTPPALLLIGRRGQPAGWSPFANTAGNYNVAVTGKSGSGKSVLMQELVAGIVGAEGEAVVIDDGRSFQHTAEALGGTFIAFGKDAACLNPFAMIDSAAAQADGDYREECFAMLAGVFSRMCRRRGTIDDIEAALIHEAIAAAWDEGGNAADLAAVRKHLQARGDLRAADMATALGPWCPGGSMGRLFEGTSVPDLGRSVTVFELAELKGRGDLQAVVLMLVVFLATQRMYHGERTRAKAIVIDEAWDLLSGDDSRAFLEGAARRARKYRGSLVTGTQSVNDYYANPAARAAWENSDWVIFLAQKDESVELLKSEKRIHCDPGMEQALKSLTTADGRFAELVLHGPDGWRVARLVLDPWSVALYSSRGDAFAEVERLKAGGLTTVEAIDRIAGEERPTASETQPASHDGGQQ
ncbi:MAG: type IV secretion system protein TraC [Gammaproteobacteria bacterium]|nr:type IV secretion system protein TraC [Gammaproteobacteria bacterium]